MLQVRERSSRRQLISTSTSSPQRFTLSLLHFRVAGHVGTEFELFMKKLAVVLRLKWPAWSRCPSCGGKSCPEDSRPNPATLLMGFAAPALSMSFECNMPQKTPKATHDHTRARLAQVHTKGWRKTKNLMYYKLISTSPTKAISDETLRAQGPRKLCGQAHPKGHFGDEEYP